MAKALLLLSFSVCACLCKAQSADSIVQYFTSVNNTIANISCTSGKGNIISNRAMNIFLTNKVGTYLSTDNDLSLYKNSITFNTAQGTFSVLHNMRQPVDKDVPVKSSFFIGARANILNGINATFNNKHYINDFGALIKITWMGKTKTYFDKCNNKSFQNQKQVMDALRASILNLMIAEIKLKDSVFEKSLTALHAEQVPGQNLDSAKSIIKKSFYADLQDEFNLKFAEMQASALINTNNYKLIATNWTTIGAYVPLMSEKFYVANSFTTKFQEKHLYPAEISVTHTRLWESAKFGRIFLKFNGSISPNNSYYNNELQKLNFVEYKNNGGTDPNASQQNSNELLIGTYKTFITPKLSASFVYIPPDWHLGVSLSTEQNFGTYKALNGKIGLPVVLIDKNGDPAITFEFQVNFFDMSNKVERLIKVRDKTSVGFSIGVPFSKKVY